MSYGLRVRNESGAITFDSTSDKILHFTQETYISGVGFTNTTYSYPELKGKKIVAMLTAPYQTGDIDACKVLSCRITYPNGVPTIYIFVDNSGIVSPICDGYLVIFATGISL